MAFFNPYQSYQPLYQQPTGILWVGSEMEAQNYPIAPNNAVALWDRSGKTVYLKSADATGKPSMVVYDLTERVLSRADGVLPDGGKTTPEYATKAEVADALAQIRAEIKKLKESGDDE